MIAEVKQSKKVVKDSKSQDLFLIKLQDLTKNAKLSYCLISEAYFFVKVGYDGFLHHLPALQLKAPFCDADSNFR